MNTKKNSSHKRSPLFVGLALIVALAAFLYSNGYLDSFLPTADKPAATLSKSKDPDKHIDVAKKLLKDLPQKERCSHNKKVQGAPCYVDKYEREPQFGKAWVDVDQDGCATREQVLERDMKDVKKKGCKVVSGTLEDPYTGKTISDRSKVDIDHVIPLALAWDTGADQWSQGKRVAFANDLNVNLIASDAVANQQDKKDKTLSEWEPETDYTCTYTIKYVVALSDYGLPITPDDYKAAKRNLDSCKVVYGEPTDAKPLDDSVQKYAERF